MPSLTKKTTPLGYSKAFHLLRRTTYNITKARILQFAAYTPEQAITELFNFTEPVPPSPLNSQMETIVPTVASPTITDTMNTDPNVKNDLYWWMYQAMKDPSAQHRIAFWLHLLFVTDDEAAFFTNFDYKELLRKHANGSLKDLAVRMTSNPRMLIYLSNYLNKKNSPNQNYAREFLELFTILKGPQVATGNYTNYTEADVQQAARVFTGFTLTSSAQLHKTARLNLVDPVTNLPKGFISVVNHDIGDKTFSAAFGNTVITGGTTEAGIQAELESFVTMVFNQDETAKAYCRRMYRYFVGRNITSEIENGIIVPLAAFLKNNNYNVLPTLKELLWSQHFYDEEDSTSGDQTIGSLVKSPLELYLQMFNLLQLATPSYTANPEAIHGLFSTVNYYGGSASLPLFYPSTVNGYAAYSSSPHYDKNWITTSSLRVRYTYTIDLLISGFTKNGFLYKIFLPQFVKDSGYFSNPNNPDTLLTDFFAILHIEVAAGTRYTYFRDIFMGGLSNANWNSEWNNYLSSGNSNAVKIPIDRLVKALIKSPEFQVL